MSGVENVAGFDLGNIVSQNSLIFSILEFLFRFLPVFLVVFYPVSYTHLSEAPYQGRGYFPGGAVQPAGGGYGRKPV